MHKRNCFVILQSRTDSEYNDFIGKFYHFPGKYLGQLNTKDIEFVYYEPKARGEGVYFGYGKIKRIFDDKQQVKHYFAEIADYKPFSKPVPFLSGEGEKRESGPGFNAQNSVRTISPEALDGICLDGGIILNFSADIHLMRVLGEQLIATEKVGILELIKNSYDAHATYCKVRLENIPGLLPAENSDERFKGYDGPVIVIEDDGDGMDRNTIENGWLRPASTLKTSLKDDIRKRLAAEKDNAVASGAWDTYEKIAEIIKQENGGRIPLGEKGVGRFATHRLGTKLAIRTKTAESNYELVLDIDWDKFDSYKAGNFVNIEDVGVSLSRQAPSRDYGKKGSGTQIIIHSGRTGYSFTPEIIRDIQRTIHGLKSPHKTNLGFDATFSCPQIGADERPIWEQFPPLFSITAIVDEVGRMDYELEFNPPSNVPMPKDNLSGNGYDLRHMDSDGAYWSSGNPGGSFRKPHCGAFLLQVKYWLRGSPWIQYGPDRDAFNEYLDKYGGISVYRDGLNIFPAEWGAEVDWLELSKRHIKKGSKLSYYNMIGNLETDQTVNLSLTDKTDREGMLKNPAFNDLSRLSRAVLFYAENFIRGKREKYNELAGDLIREPQKIRNVTKESATILDALVQNYDFVRNPWDIYSALENAEFRKQKASNLQVSLKNLQKSIKFMEDLQDSLAENAGFGLAVASSVHEIAKITTNFYNGIAKLLKEGRFDEERIEGLRHTSESLKSELRRLGPLRAIRNETPSEVSLKKVVKHSGDVFHSRLEDAGIALSIEGDDFKVTSRFGVLAQIFSNLIENSIYWLGRPARDGKRIRIAIDSITKTVTFADNGPGFDKSILPYVFEAGYSMKIPPSGLGLYICKFYLGSMKGNIHLASPKEAMSDMSGAQFVMDFSRVEIGDMK